MISYSSIASYITDLLYISFYCFMDDNLKKFVSNGKPAKKYIILQATLTYPQFEKESYWSHYF